MKRKTAMKKIMSYGLSRNWANYVMRKRPVGASNRVVVMMARYARDIALMKWFAVGAALRASRHGAEDAPVDAQGEAQGD